MLSYALWLSPTPNDINNRDHSNKQQLQHIWEANRNLIPAKQKVVTSVSLENKFGIQQPLKVKKVSSTILIKTRLPINHLMLINITNINPTRFNLLCFVNPGKRQNQYNQCKQRSKRRNKQNQHNTDNMWGKMMVKRQNYFLTK